MFRFLIHYILSKISTCCAHTVTKLGRQTGGDKERQLVHTMSGVKTVSVLVLAVAVLVYLYKAYLQTPLPVLYNGRVHPDFQEVADLYR